MACIVTDTNTWDVDEDFLEFARTLPFEEDEENNIVRTTEEDDVINAVLTFYETYRTLSSGEQSLVDKELVKLPDNQNIKSMVESVQSKPEPMQMHMLAVATDWEIPSLTNVICYCCGMSILQKLD